VARIISTITLNPFAVVGTRLEVNGNADYNGMIDAFVKI